MLFERSHRSLLVRAINASKPSLKLLPLEENSKWHIKFPVKSDRILISLEFWGFFVKEFTGWLYELRLSCNFLVQCAFLSLHLCFFICSIMSCFKSQNFVHSFNYCSGSFMCLSYSLHLTKTDSWRSNGCLCPVFYFFYAWQKYPSSPAACIVAQLERFIMQLLSSSKASDTGYTGGRVLDLIVLYRRLYILAMCIHSW